MSTLLIKGTLTIRNRTDLYIGRIQNNFLRLDRRNVLGRGQYDAMSLDDYHWINSLVNHLFYTKMNLSSILTSQDPASTEIAGYIHYPFSRIQKQKIPMASYAELNDRNWGAAEGMTKEEAAQEFGQSALKSWLTDDSAAPDGGESREQMWTRIKPLVDDETSHALANGNVLIVCPWETARTIATNLRSLGHMPDLSLIGFRLWSFQM